MDVVPVDIPNEFIQTRVENEKDMAFIKIQGILVDILVEISPEAYKSYISQNKKGNKQLLVQCRNTLYGTMVASLLYCRKFVKSLTDIDFTINPYDPCVANKIIEVEQMAICFHVDDCKLSYRKKKVVDTPPPHISYRPGTIHPKLWAKTHLQSLPVALRTHVHRMLPHRW
jgi:hypothetical protein